jgi:hypothetical protein
LITQARVLFNKPYDLQGAIAVSGQINEQLLGKLLIKNARSRGWLGALKIASNSLRA